MPVSSNEVLEIQATMEFRFTLKRVRDMVITYSQMPSLAKWLSVNVRTAWLWFRVPLLSLIFFSIWNVKGRQVWIIFTFFSQLTSPLLKTPNIKPTKLTRYGYIKNILVLDLRRYHMFSRHQHKNKTHAKNYDSGPFFYQTKFAAREIQQRHGKKVVLNRRKLQNLGNT